MIRVLTYCPLFLASCKGPPYDPPENVSKRAFSHLKFVLKICGLNFRTCCLKSLLARLWLGNCYLKVARLETWSCALVPFLGQNVEARAYLGIFRRIWNKTWCDETWLSVSWSCALYRFLGQNVEARAYLGIFRRTWNYDSCFDMLSFVPGLLQGSPLRSARKCLQTSLFTFKVCLENLRFEFPDLLLEIFARQAVAWQLRPLSGKAGNLILCFGTVFGTKRRGTSLSRDL